jgi:hypothetical protein
MNVHLQILFADISVPLWIAIGQWVLLFALGILVVVAYRQLGYMMHLKDKGSERDGLSVGEQAPSFTYIPAKQRGGEPRFFEPKGSWSLLLFADPGCISCQNALRALERFIVELPSEMRVLVVTSSEPALIDAIEEFRTTSVELGIVDRAIPFKLYRTHATPFAYVIDAQGLIQAKGGCSSENDFRKIVRKFDRNVLQIVPRSR